MGLRNRKWLAAILIAALAITATTGAVYAYLSASGGSVTNTFTPEADANPTVSVSTGAQANTYAVSVDVGEPGYAVYVRAVVVVTWKNDAGNVLASAPAYSVETGSGWFKHGDFYYYEWPVSSGSISGLTVTCNDTAPEGYELHIEVISQTIQALGETDGDNPIPAVQDAWGVYIDDGKLSATAP